MAMQGWPNQEEQVFSWIREEHPEATSKLPRQTIREMFPEYMLEGPRPESLNLLIQEMKILGRKESSEEFVKLLKLFPFDKNLSFVILNGNQKTNDWAQDYLRKAVKGRLGTAIRSYPEMHKILAQKAGKRDYYLGSEHRALETATILYMVAVNPSLNDGHISPYAFELLTKAYKNFSMSLTEK